MRYITIRLNRHHECLAESLGRTGDGRVRVRRWLSVPRCWEATTKCIYPSDITGEAPAALVRLAMAAKPRRSRS